MDGMMSDELHANGSLVKDGHIEGKDGREDEANRYFRLVNNMVGAKHSGPSWAERDGASERGLCLKGCKIGGAAVAKR